MIVQEAGRQCGKTAHALEAIRCPRHGAEMIQRPLGRQTPEQKWCGVWWDCQRCAYSLLFMSVELRARYAREEPPRE